MNEVRPVAEKRGDERLGEAARSRPPEGADAVRDDAWGWTRRQRIGLGMLLGVLIFFLGVQYLRRPFQLEDGVVVVSGERVTLPVRVDPNDAGVEELGRIPHVGETLARRIVEYRDARKATASEGIVFRRAEDLDGVPGVGKRLVEEMRGFLRFPGEGAEGNDQ
jgi:hypothetical protein